MKIKFLLTVLIFLFPNIVFSDQTLLKRDLSSGLKPSQKVEKILLDISESDKILKEFNYFDKASKNALKNVEVKRYRGGGNIYKNNKNRVPFIFHEEGSGAGSLLDNKGHIISNWHVISDAKGSRVGVAFQGDDIESIIKRKEFIVGDVILINKKQDLAIVKILNVPPGVKPVKIGSPNSVEVGDKIHVIGHPHNLLWTYAQGFISAKRSFKWNYEKDFEHSAQVIQHQAPISPGNSGGALFNDRGELVAINTLKRKGENLNFAVTVDQALEILNNPKKFKNKSSNSVTKEKKYDCFKTEDFDKDGSIDTCYVDDNNNGISDGYWVDDNEDGRWESFHSDKNEDGKVEVILVDTNNNGKWDLGYMDTNGDNKDDVVGYDYNEDGEWDEFKKIT